MKLVVAQSGDDPTLGYQNRIFYLGLGKKRVLQTVLMMAQKFSRSHIHFIL